MTASRSDLATTVGSIARGYGANAPGGRRPATVTSMFLRAKGWARAWPTAPILQLRSLERFPDLCRRLFPGRHGVGPTQQRPSLITLKTARPTTCSPQLNPGYNSEPAI